MFWSTRKLEKEGSLTSSGSLEGADDGELARKQHAVDDEKLDLRGDAVEPNRGSTAFFSAWLCIFTSRRFVIRHNNKSLA
jgi:hypothetical protein